jgi:GntR family transcriptional regulator
MEFREGNIPLYFQFYLKVKNDILLGEIEPGSRMPNIEELHEKCGVSHATVRRALALLEKEGLIKKRRGLGIIVRDHVDLPIWNPTSFLDLTQVAMEDQQPQTLFCGWVSPPRRIEKYFGDQPGVFRHDKIFKARRLWASESDPRRKRITDAYFAAFIVSQIGEEKLEMSHFQQSITEHPLYRSLRIRQTLRPWICDMETAVLLGIPDGTPVFHRTWIRLNPNDEVLVVSETITTANSLVRVIDMEIPVENDSQGHL